MTPANPLVGQQPSQPQSTGLFGRIGAFLRQHGPEIQDIGNHLAAAGGNYAPLELAHQNKELALRQQLGQSQIQTADLNRQLLSKQVNDYQTPQQRADLDVATSGRRLEQAREYTPPQDIVAPMPEGGMGHYQREYNRQTKSFDVNPTMIRPQVPNPAASAMEAGQSAAESLRASSQPSTGVGPQQEPSLPPSVTSQPAPSLMPPVPPTIAGPARQLPAISKPLGSGMIVPDTNSPTGYSKEMYDGLGNVIARIPNALPPAAFVPSETSATRTSFQKDANGNLVAIPETSSTSKVPTMPGVPNQGRSLGRGGGGAGVASPVKDAQGNQIHAPISADARKNISQIATTEKLIAQVVPELQQRVQQSGGDMNSLWDSATQRSAWAEYKHGGVVPDNIDPTLAHLLPTIAQLQIVGGLPYLRGTRSYQYIQQIQQHLPDPEKDSPALMIDKIHSLQQTMPLLRQSVLESEMNPTGTAAPPTKPSTGGTWNPRTGKFE